MELLDRIVILFLILVFVKLPNFSMVMHYFTLLALIFKRKFFFLTTFRILGWPLFFISTSTYDSIVVLSFLLQSQLLNLNVVPLIFSPLFLVFHSFTMKYLGVVSLYLSWLVFVGLEIVV